MTINDLKELYEDLQNIRNIKKRIKLNKDLSPNQKKKECAWYTPKEKQIKSILKRYFSIFTVNATLLARKICDVLSHNISESEVSFQHACIGKWYEKEYFEGWERFYQGEKCLIIYINSLGKTEKISLFNKPVSKDYTFDTDYILGNYNLNCYELLSDNKIKYSQLFHKACWLAVEENLKLKNNDLKSKVDVKKKLILKKIQELQLEVSKMQNKSATITNDETIVFTDKEMEDITKKI